MIETAKWYEYAEKNLGSGDKIQKTYPGNLDGKNGYLMMSNNKLMFVHEEGFLHKTYELTLDMPYNKIGKINREGTYELDLIDKEGTKHVFKEYEISMNPIYESLEKLSHISE